MVNDIDLMLNTTILLHHWHLTTSSFKFRGCNIRNGHLQGATTKMEQRVAQHCLQQSSTSRYGIDIVNSKFDQMIWNNKFDQKIWIQHRHRHRHHDHQDGQEEQQPSSTLKGHVHNNLADIITSMVESECTTSGQHLVKALLRFHQHRPQERATPHLVSSMFTPSFHRRG